MRLSGCRCRSASATPTARRRETSVWQTIPNFGGGDFTGDDRAFGIVVEAADQRLGVLQREKAQRGLGAADGGQGEVEHLVTTAFPAPQHGFRQAVERHHHGPGGGAGVVGRPIQGPAPAVELAQGGIGREGAEHRDRAAFQQHVEAGQRRAGFGTVAAGRGPAELRPEARKGGGDHWLCAAKFKGTKNSEKQTTPSLCKTKLTLQERN